MPSWSPGSWVHARTPPKQPASQRGHEGYGHEGYGEVLTPAPLSPKVPAPRRCASRQRAVATSDRKDRKGLQVCRAEISVTATPSRTQEWRRAFEMTRSTPPTKTTKDGKMPRRRSASNAAVAKTNSADVSHAASAYASQRRGGYEMDQEAMKELQAENQSLRALADRLQLQLAAVEESERRYQNAAEELLIGVWEDQMDSGLLDRASAGDAASRTCCC